MPYQTSSSPEWSSPGSTVGSPPVVPASFSPPSSSSPHSAFNTSISTSIPAFKTIVTTPIIFHFSSKSSTMLNPLPHYSPPDSQQPQSPTSPRDAISTPSPRSLSSSLSAASSWPSTPYACIASSAEKI